MRLVDRKTLAASLRRFTLVCLGGLGLGSLVPNPAGAQPLPIIAGAIGGFAAGGWTTIGAFVSRARLGNFVFDVGHVT
jgi:hypothetical protein